ncbi:MAG: trans-sulfuration enzyme family protein [Bacteroidota bacterium]
MNLKTEPFHFETLAVRGGAMNGDHAVAPTIVQTSTFFFASVEEAAETFAGKRDGFLYTRLGNPTVAAFERQMALLEQGEAALAFGSGMAAIVAGVLAYVRKGQSLVSSKTLYGGTHSLFVETLPHFGVDVRFVEGHDPKSFAKAIDDNTGLVFIETPGNPTLCTIDIQAVAEELKRWAVPLMVDNTFATPYFQRPLSLGARAVVHSATKYIGGHADAVGGVIIGSSDAIAATRKFLRDLGGALSPFNAWLFLRGLKTLPLRMERHAMNAGRIASFLVKQPNVRFVYYPGLEEFPGHLIAKKQMTGFGGMMAFELDGGKEAGVRLLNSLKLIHIAVSLGDADSLIEHPASMTHHSYTSEELQRSNIPEGLIRLSVGLEHPEDLISDLRQALAQV